MMIPKIARIRALTPLAAVTAMVAADAAHGAAPDLSAITRPGANIQRSMKLMAESTAEQRSV